MKIETTTEYLMTVIVAFLIGMAGYIAGVLY